MSRRVISLWTTAWSSRRVAIANVTLLCCLVIVLVAGSTAARADDWPEHRGPGRDGVWKETGIVDKLPEHLTINWRTPVSRGYSGPAVAGGRVFITDFVTEQEGGVRGQERALALDEKTGKILWVKEWPAAYGGMSWPNGPGATPIVDGDTVYILGRMGRLWAFNVKSGEIVWSHDLAKEYNAKDGSYGFVSSPLIDGERLIVNAGATPVGKVMAFNKLTGQEIWRALPNTESIGVSSAKIFEYGGVRQLMYYHPEALVSLNPVTGEVYWQLPFHSEGSMNPMTPEFSNGYVLVSTFYNGSMMAKLDPKTPTAKMLWKGKSDSEVATDGLHAVMNTPIIMGDYFYGTCSYGQLRCLKVETGERVWETQNLTQEYARWANAILVRNGDRFFATTDRGDLVTLRISPAGYEELSRTFLIKPTSPPGNRRKLTYVNWVHPAYANRNIYIRNDEEIISASLAAPVSTSSKPAPARPAAAVAAAARPRSGAAPAAAVASTSAAAVPGQKLDIWLVRGLRRAVANPLRTNYMLSNMYAMTGGGGPHTLELEVDDGVLLVDTKAKGWEKTHVNTIRFATAAPITRIINTNPAGAATNSNFPDVKEIFAHENTKARLAKLDEFKGANAKFLPNRTFTDKLSVPLKTVGVDGTNRVDLFYFGPAHTDGDVVAVFPSFGVAYFGELFPAKMLPVIEVANGGSALAYPETLAKAAAALKDADIDSILPAEAPVPFQPGARGAPVIGTWLSMKDLNDYVEFNRTFLNAVKEAFAAKKSVDEAVASVQMPDKFKAYKMDNAKTNAEIIYNELRRQ